MYGLWLLQQNDFKCFLCYIEAEADLFDHLEAVYQAVNTTYCHLVSLWQTNQ